MKLPWAQTLMCTLLLVAACRGERRPAAAAAAHPAPPDTARSAEPVNLYALAAAGLLSPRAAAARPLVYVPNSHDGTVTVIDPRTYRVVRTFPTGTLPQHVVPSYDLSTLWVANNLGNTLTPIDPATGREGQPVPVSDPYNLYFTPDGRFALVVAVTGLPAFSRLLPEVPAVFPASRLKPMMSAPPVLLAFPAEMPPPLPCGALLPVMAILFRMTESMEATFSKMPPPSTLPATLALPALLLLITVPVSISRFVDALIPPPSPAAWLPEIVLL